MKCMIAFAFAAPSVLGTHAPDHLYRPLKNFGKNPEPGQPPHAASKVQMAKGVAKLVVAPDNVQSAREFREDYPKDGPGPLAATKQTVRGLEAQSAHHDSQVQAKKAAAARAEQEYATDTAEVTHENANVEEQRAEVAEKEENANLASDKAAQERQDVFDKQADLDRARQELEREKAEAIAAQNEQKAVASAAAASKAELGRAKAQHAAELNDKNLQKKTLSEATLAVEEAEKRRSAAERELLAAKQALRDAMDKSGAHHVALCLLLAMMM